MFWFTSSRRATSPPWLAALAGAPTGPKSGSSPNGPRTRPNRIGATVCELLSVGTWSLRVRGLDAIAGTPVLDVKAYFTQFGPRGPVRQPAWAEEPMRDDWSIVDDGTSDYMFML